MKSHGYTHCFSSFYLLLEQPNASFPFLSGGPTHPSVLHAEPSPPFVRPLSCTEGATTCVRHTHNRLVHHTSFPLPLLPGRVVTWPYGMRCTDSPCLRPAPLPSERKRGTACLHPLRLHPRIHTWPCLDASDSRGPDRRVHLPGTPELNLAHSPSSPRSWVWGPHCGQHTARHPT